MTMKNMSWRNEINYGGQSLIVKKSKKGRLYYSDPYCFEIKYVWCTGCKKMHEVNAFGIKKGREGVAAFQSTCKYHRRGGPLKIRTNHKPNELGNLKCKKCLRELPTDCFHPTRKEKGQFNSSCKECNLERKRSKRQTAKSGACKSKKVGWNKESIVNEVNDLYNKNLDLSVTGIRANNSKLYAAALRHFGSFRDAVDEAGLNYQEICKLNMNWDIEKIKQRLTHRKEQGKLMKSSVVRLEEPDLYGACLKICGGYRDAFDTTFGEGSFFKTFLESKQAFAFGFEFEKLVKEIFSLLNYKFEYQRSFENGSLRPDFYCVDLNHIFEVKLSEYTDYNGYNTFSKYGHLANNITIIYLQGNLEKKAKNENNIEIQPISYLVNQIEDLERKHAFERKIKNLREAINKL